MLVLFALGLPVLLAATGVVIDLGQLFVVRAKLQATADATALAAAARLPEEGPVKAEALHYAQLNYGAYGTVVAEDEVVLGLWEAGTFTPMASDAYPAGTEPNAVWVAARRSANRENGVRLFFGAFLGKRWGNVDAAATAVYEEVPGGACIYQLDPNAKPGFAITSDSHVVANCGVRVNGTDRCESLVITSHSSLEAEDIYVASSCTKVEGSTVSPDPETGSSQAADPLSWLTPPDVGACNHTDFKVDKDGNTDIFPGVYCKGIIVSGSKTHVTMMPGTYVMRGGGFNIESGASVTGNGVTIYNSCNLVGGCTTSDNKKDAQPVKITSGSSTNLSAPATGPLEGILFFQDRLMYWDMQNEISSNVTSPMDGILYFPTQFLRLHSGSVVDANVILVAGKLEVSSGTTFGFSGMPSNLPSSLAGDRIIRLVQ